MNDFRHEQKVHAVARALREHSASGRPGDPERRDTKINIVDLSAIPHIDPQGKSCVAEPGVTFKALARETPKHRLVPMIVPELKTITIGGAVAGGSVENIYYRTCFAMIVRASGYPRIKVWRTGSFVSWHSLLPFTPPGCFPWPGVFRFWSAAFRMWQPMSSSLFRLVPGGFQLFSLMDPSLPHREDVPLDQSEPHERYQRQPFHRLRNS